MPAEPSAAPAPTPPPSTLPAIEAFEASKAPATPSTPTPPAARTSRTKPPSPTAFKAGRRTKERVDCLPPDLLEPVVEPRFSIDGWTYVGTALEECFPPQIEAELAQTVHIICTRLATAWNYRRAAQLLESQCAYSQAYAVLEIWSAEGPDPDPTLPKWRGRLARAVLANTES